MMREILIYNISDKWQRLFDLIERLMDLMDPAIEFYTGKSISTGLQDYLTVIMREKVDPSNPILSRQQSDYLDFDRAFEFCQAFTKFLHRANELLTLIKDPKYMAYFTGKKSPGWVEETTILINEALSLYDVIRTHINMYKYDLYSASWHWAFNRWPVKQVMEQLEASHQSFPGASEIYAHCMRNFWEKVIYSSDVDPSWNVNRLKLERLIRENRLTALGLPLDAGDADIIQYSNSPSLPILDLTGMPYMNNLTPASHNADFHVFSAPPANAIIIKRQHGTNILYHLTDLIRFNKELSNETVLTGLNANILKKYNTISPIVVGSGDANMNDMDLFYEQDDIVRKKYEDDPNTVKIYETYDEKSYRQLVPFVPKIPISPAMKELIEKQKTAKTSIKKLFKSLDVEKDSEAVEDAEDKGASDRLGSAEAPIESTSRLIRQSTIVTRYNELLQSVILKNCKSDLDLQKIRNTMDTTDRNQNMITRMMELLRAEFSAEFDKSWESFAQSYGKKKGAGEKNDGQLNEDDGLHSSTGVVVIMGARDITETSGKQSDKRPNKKILQVFMNISPVIERVITQDIIERNKNSSSHYSLVNRNLWRCRELRGEYLRLIDNWFKKLIPVDLISASVADIKEYYMAVANTVIDKLSENRLFEDSQINIKSIALQTHLYKIT
jgi:hypothetical protein